MKNLIVLFCVCLYSAVSAQKMDATGVPDSVHVAFEKMHGKTPVKSWSRDENGHYTAEFIKGGEPASAVFNANGYFIRGREVIPRSKVPARVINEAKKLYPTYEITGFAKQWMIDDKFKHIVLIRKKDDIKGLMFDENFNYMGEEIKEHEVKKQ